MLIAVVAAVAVAGLWAGWMIKYRPLAVYAFQTRLALRMAGLRRTAVEAPAGRQAVFVGGSGPVVVLLHGAGDNAGTWFRVVPELVRSHTVIVPDLAGHGDSAPASGPISVEQVLTGVEAVIDTLAGGKPVTMVGNSLGAWVAMLVAQRRPERVGLLVCVDGGAIRGRNLHAVVLPRTRAEAQASVAQTRDPASPAVPDFVLDDIVRQARVGPLARFAASEVTMDRWVLADAQLRELRVPVQLIWGASDRLVPLDYAERMKVALPRAGLVTLERCGHVPQLECPDAFILALRKAIDSQQPTADSSPTHPGKP